MKNGIILLAAALLQGCASLAVVQRNGMENPAEVTTPDEYKDDEPTILPEFPEDTPTVLPETGDSTITEEGGGDE